MSNISLTIGRTPVRVMLPPAAAIFWCVARKTRNPAAAFAAMNAARRELFAKFASVKIDADDTPHRIALHILSLYKDRFLNR